MTNQVWRWTIADSGGVKAVPEEGIVVQTTLIVTMFVLAGAVVLNTLVLARANRLLGAICRLITEAIHDGPDGGSDR